MPAAGNSAILLACGRRLRHVVQQRCGKYNFALLRRRLAPSPVFNKSFADHPRVNPDVAFRMIDRILRTPPHIAHELKLVTYRVPIETPIGRLRRKKKVHPIFLSYIFLSSGRNDGQSQMPQPSRSLFGRIVRSIQWLPESETACRKLARTNLKRSTTRPSASTLM